MSKTKKGFFLGDRLDQSSRLGCKTDTQAQQNIMVNWMVSICAPNGDVIGDEPAGYSFYVTKSKDGGVKSIRHSAGEVASNLTSLRALDDLLSMVNQRKDAGTDSWWETYRPFFFLHAQAREGAEDERAGILKDLKEAEQKKDHEEANRLRVTLKDLMVAERAPDAFQLEIKLHMERELKTVQLQPIYYFFLRFNTWSGNLNRTLREKRKQKQQQQRVATEWVRRQKDLMELNRLAKKLGLQVQQPVEEDDEEENDNYIDLCSSDDDDEPRGPTTPPGEKLAESFVGVSLDSHSPPPKKKLKLK